jgi:hypothetical protein
VAMSANWNGRFGEIPGAGRYLLVMLVADDSRDGDGVQLFN